MSSTRKERRWRQSLVSTMSSTRKGGGVGGEGRHRPGHGAASQIPILRCRQNKSSKGIVFMGSRMKIKPFGGARPLISIEGVENPFQTGPILAQDPSTACHYRLVHIDEGQQTSFSQLLARAVE
jgi:hypothetical protein